MFLLLFECVSAVPAWKWCSANRLASSPLLSTAIAPGAMPSVMCGCTLAHNPRSVFASCAGAAAMWPSWRRSKMHKIQRNLPTWNGRLLDPFQQRGKACFEREIICCTACHWLEPVWFLHRLPVEIDSSDSQDNHEVKRKGSTEEPLSPIKYLFFQAGLSG